MSRKKKQNIQTSKPAVFHTASFAQLKSLNIAKQPEPEPAPEKTALVQDKTAAVNSDFTLFMDAMADVTPLGKQKAILKAQSATSGDALPPLPQKSPASNQPFEKNAEFLEEVARLKLDVRFADELPEEEEPKPLSGNRLKMLKRGIIRVDRQLDLHGLTRDEAVFALENFVRSARNANEKAILVITGKGLHSAGEPVLGQAVIAWLREHGRHQVLEFTPAPKEFGGSGALIVFLRSLDKNNSL